MADDNELDLMIDGFVDEIKAPAAPKPAAKPAKASAEPVKSAEPSIEAQVDEEIKGLATVEFGGKVSSIAIPRFKGTKEMKSRIALLTSKVTAVKTHYCDGIGGFICFDGVCCENEGTPRVKYVIPVVNYTNVLKDGKLPQGAIPELEVKALVLGADAYSALVDTVTNSGRKLTDVDIIVSCSDENYQKLTFTADGTVNGALWHAAPTAKATVEYFKENRNKLYQAAGRVLSAETYLRRKGFVKPTAEQPAVTPTVAAPSDLASLLDD